MFTSIKNFMQSVDRNGEWLEANEEEAEYMVEVLYNWIDDGLEETKRVKDYITFLKTL